VSRIDCLIEQYLDLPEVKRLKELEPYIDNNKKLEKLINELDELKAITKEALKNQNYDEYRTYKASYDIKYEEMLNIPFVEEYRELLDDIYNKLNLTATIIEKEIAKHLK
jgi:cell fate (sporulation/competence/biofilm development) regulator YmcA (YheA/YmcA/DUF963 family)